MLEKQIEKKVCDYAKEKGMLCYKFTSPSRRAVPDRLFINRDGEHFYIEFKREGEKATLAQEREHHRLRGHRVNVYVVDDVYAGKRIIDLWVTEC